MGSALSKTYLKVGYEIDLVGGKARLFAEDTLVSELGFVAVGSSIVELRVGIDAPFNMGMAPTTSVRYDDVRCVSP